MAKDKANGGGGRNKWGFNPLNVGYTAGEESGDSPASEAAPPKAPRGGTGQVPASPPAASSTTSKTRWEP
jgi:hypothetical protein